MCIVAGSRCVCLCVKRHSYVVHWTSTSIFSLLDSLCLIVFMPSPAIYHQKHSAFGLSVCVRYYTPKRFSKLRSLHTILLLLLSLLSTFVERTFAGCDKCAKNNSYTLNNYVFSLFLNVIRVMSGDLSSSVQICGNSTKSLTCVQLGTKMNW